ncbi:peptidase S9 [candidate division WOR-1 bacterium RIFCSPHIGHO2_01_FULL_53_15]|uniref:Peptidase S9 n=1 Tax=candidate division WOR-1 bacterium RIFCSPHIGHO2_01_FULL_53_15 TaxID=1802564 RepID=A0A1F4Q352_UNCSA|nr:MAG: peptidase S9 [candidate division WOR-1 bacterium RIFCSPHIGHO2_01_FULL_53_15]OGC10400.1 MAG: peptidase S9 [candidate division WOR-1 bacterium RIFCSPHIGHO2_02_FULL_53_26]
MAAKQLDGHGLKRLKILKQNNSYTEYLITYLGGGLKISGVMYVPKGEGPFPVIVLGHGYIDPWVYTVGRGLRREQDYLARRGFVVVHPDYRNHGLSDKDPASEMNFRLGYVEDVINAVEAVKTSGFSFIDTDKIGMLGHSLGGGIALNIMTAKPDLIKAFVLYAPVSANYVDNFNRWIRRGRPEIAEKIIAAHGSPEANPGFWATLSAINYLDRLTAPVTIHHGDRDQSVPIAWSDNLAAALVRKGKKVVYYRYPGERHEFGKDWNLFMSRTARFFNDSFDRGE